MRIECGGNELTVTSTHLADDGDVVVHVRLPDKVMERLRQPDNLSAKAANSCLPKPVPNDGILDEARRIRDEVRRRHTCIEDVHSDVVKLRDEAHGFEKSARTNSIASQEARDGALDAAKRLLGRKVLPDKTDPTYLITREQALREFHAAAEERDKLRGQYNAAMDELKNEQKRHAETVERLRAATADPTPSFDPDGNQHADTLSREQLKQRWHAACDERDEARQKYTACKAELLREQERHNQTNERLRQVMDDRDDVRKQRDEAIAERDEWKQRAEDTGANLRNVTTERDNWMETARNYCRDVKYWQDKDEAGSDDATVRQLVAEREEWKRRAQVAEAACKHAEINPETGEKWGTGAPLLGRNPDDVDPPLNAGDMSGEPVVETHPGGFDAGASTPGASPQQEVSK